MLKKFHSITSVYAPQQLQQWYERVLKPLLTSIQDPLTDLARLVIASNNEHITAEIESFSSKEVDQIRILINLDIMNLVDTHCKPVQINQFNFNRSSDSLAHWLLTEPSRLLSLEQAVRRIVLQQYIAKSLPFNVMLRCSHVLPSAALLTGRVLAVYSESNERYEMSYVHQLLTSASLVNYTRCKRITCQQLHVLRDYCSCCGHECAADDSTRALVRTREVLVVPDGAQFRQVFVRLQGESSSTSKLMMDSSCVQRS